MEINVIVIMPLVLLVLVVFSAFFAMLEVAFVRLNRYRLRYLVEQKIKNAELVQQIVSKMDKLITTILVGNNFVNIAISAMGTAICIFFFGNNLASVAFSTVVITLIVLILGEITPKVFAVKHSERVALKVSWIMRFIINLLDPLVRVFLRLC